MWKSHFIVACRVFLSQPVTTLISVFGLAIGITVALLVFAMVRFETGYDSWIPDHTRVFRLESVQNIPGQAPRRTRTAPAAIAPYLGRLEGVSQTARLFADSVNFPSNGQARKATVYFADEGFFRLFPVKVLAGDPSDALANPSSLVVTKDEAIRLFGSDDALGKTILGNGTVALRIGAVIENWPANSHLDIGILAHLNSPLFHARESMLEKWGASGGAVYLKFNRAIKADELVRPLGDLLGSVAPAHYGMPKNGAPPFYVLGLRPVADTHLYGEGDGISGQEANPVLLRILSTVAIMVLFIAGANYVNTTTAQALRRSREIAIRRILGARRIDLVLQFELEAMLVGLVAAIFALILANLLQPFFSQLLAQPMPYSVLDLEGIIFGISVGLVLGLLSGAYPAWVASATKINSAAARRGGGNAANRVGILVVAQFIVSIAMASGVTIMMLQIRYTNNLNPGFTAQGAAVLWDVDQQDTSRVQAFKLAVSRLPGIQLAATADAVPGDGKTETASASRGADAKPISVRVLNFGSDMLELLKITPVVGRTFRTDHYRDFVDVNAETPFGVILNQAAAHSFGFDSPEKAIGQQIRLAYKGTRWRNATVIGVVSNFPYDSILDHVNPMLIVSDPAAISRIAVRFEHERTAEAQAGIKQLWNAYFPSAPMDMDLLDVFLQGQYKKQIRQADLLGVCTLIALLVSGLGMYSLSAIGTLRRRKEIAVRKLLGASSLNVMFLLGWQFTKPVLVASVVGWPVAYILADNWLTGFSRRMEIGLTPFAFASGVALSIALLSVAAHTLRLTRITPAHLLRDE